MEGNHDNDNHGDVHCDHCSNIIYSKCMVLKQWCFESCLTTTTTTSGLRDATWLNPNFLEYFLIFFQLLIPDSCLSLNFPYFKWNLVFKMMIVVVAAEHVRFALFSGRNTEGKMIIRNIHENDEHRNFTSLWRKKRRRMFYDERTETWRSWA